MKIIVDIGHPGHVHFFKNFIWEMRDRGHEVLITASIKDITLDLLNAYGFEYIISCKRYSGLLQGYELIKRDLQLYRIARQFKPDVIMGINCTIAAHVSRVTRARSIIFTDTEHARLANSITFPFSHTICTPSCYRDDLGKKQVRYNGYHDLAYLHPNRFTPNPAVLEEIGLQPDERFIVIRFVSWKASHDIRQHGIHDKVGLVKALEPYGRVLITSEGQLPDELQQYQIRVAPEKLHDLLYFATLYVGEGGTTASEAAVLGTSAIHISTTAKYCGVFDDLNHYDLLWTSESDEETLSCAISLLQDPAIIKTGKDRRAHLVDEKIDVTSFMIRFVENYPGITYTNLEAPRFE